MTSRAAGTSADAGSGGGISATSRRDVEEVSKPSFRDKASVTTMKGIIQATLAEHLEGDVYEADRVTERTKHIADTIRDRLRELQYDRYKFMVHVVIGERRDQGVRMGSRCFWDSDTDYCASEKYMNDDIFAVATVYAVYLY